MAISVTEKAASEVKRIISEQQGVGAMPEKIYLRMRVVGGGGSGFQHKLDPDPQTKGELRGGFDFQGAPVGVGKRSLVDFDNVTVDFHVDSSKPGLRMNNT